jgi:hypothetical protein
VSRTTRGGAEIEHPEAYAQAIKNAIHGRASAKRLREWDAAHPELAAWLTWTGFDPEGSQGDEYPLPTYTKHPLGTAPTFALRARGEWGSLSPKATELLQKIYDERTANLAKRAEQRAAEAASAEAWQPGRQIVEGEIVSVKFVAGWGYHAADVKKILVKRADGSRIYLTCPASIEQVERGARVRITVTVEPKEGEPTFAFGSRPAKSSIIVEAK